MYKTISLLCANNRFPLFCACISSNIRNTWHLEFAVNSAVFAAIDPRIV